MLRSTVSLSSVSTHLNGRIARRSRLPAAATPRTIDDTISGCERALDTSTRACLFSAATLRRFMIAFTTYKRGGGGGSVTGRTSRDPSTHQSRHVPPHDALDVHNDRALAQDTLA